MARISIKGRLGRRYVFYLIVAPLPVLLLAWTFFYCLSEFLSHPVEKGPAFALISCIYLPFVGLLGLSILRLASLQQGWHPDLLALARDGDQRELLTQIEAELDDASRVATFGEAKSFQLLPRELGDAEVWITASWLIYLIGGGIRMKFFRLDDLILIYPEENKVVLADRHGVHLRIPGSEAGRARLLAEILVRVPWALNHFDPETEKTWKEKRQEIIAAVEQRRQTIQEEQSPRSTGLG